MSCSVALTGSFASGKSFILHILKNMGFKTFSCDIFVKKLYEDAGVQQETLKLLPSLQVFDKAKIAEIIYADASARKRLENFIHPLVLKNIESVKLQNVLEKVIFIEVPLLFESGFEKYFDFTVTVFCSEQTRLSRALSKPNFNRSTYDSITSIQLPQHIKINKADFCINTDCTKPEIEKQIQEMRHVLNKKRPSVHL